MDSVEVKSGLFKIGMWWRIFYGAIRLVLGFALLMVIDVPISDLLYKLTGSELAEEPSNILFSVINTLLEAHPLSITYFLSFYLIFWGVVEIMLSACLLKHKTWAFPFTLWLIAGFIFYVIFRYTQTHSPILIGVFIVDVVMFWLIQTEFKKMKRMPLHKPDLVTEKPPTQPDSIQ